MRQRRAKRGVCTLHSTVDYDWCSQYSEQNCAVYRRKNVKFELHTVGWAGKSCSLEAIGKTDDTAKVKIKVCIIQYKTNEKTIYDHTFYISMKKNKQKCLLLI